MTIGPGTSSPDQSNQSNPSQQYKLNDQSYRSISNLRYPTLDDLIEFRRDLTTLETSYFVEENDLEDIQTIRDALTRLLSRNGVSQEVQEEDVLEEDESSFSWYEEDIPSPSTDASQKISALHQRWSS